MVRKKGNRNNNKGGGGGGGDSSRSGSGRGFLGLGASPPPRRRQARVGSGGDLSGRVSEPVGGSLAEGGQQLVQTSAASNSRASDSSLRRVRGGRVERSSDRRHGGGASRGGASRSTLITAVESMGIRDSVDENGNLVSQVYNSSTGGGPQNEIGTRLAGRADSAVVVTSNARNLWGVGERILEESGADSLTAVVFPNHSLSRVRDLAGRQGVQPLTRRLTFDPPATDVTTMVPYGATRRALTFDDAPPAVVVQCAGCQGTDHTLKVSLEADRASGVVHGCAVCNAKHRMETCPKFKSLSWWQQYKMCVLDRGRMPPLDMGTEPWITAVTMADQNATGPLPEPTSLPWTEAFARNWIRSADSRTRAAMSDFYLTRDRSLLPVDPQTETLRRALTHYDIRIPLRHIRASGAVASRIPRRL